MGLFSWLFDSGDSAASSDAESSKPLFNIDGSPMLGDFDIHSNPYGITQSWDSSSDLFGFSSDSFSNSFSSSDLFSSASDSCSSFDSSFASSSFSSSDPFSW